MKRTLIFGNGTLHKKFLAHIQQDDFIIGVDRAALWLIRRGIVPHLAVGDFDSVTKKELEIIQKKVKTIKKFSPKKNWTDMELALAEARGETIIFGWSGTRFDHTITNMHLVSDQTLIDETNRIRLLGKGRTILKPAGYRYVSFIPATKTISLQLENFTYNLPKTTIRRGSSRTVSNEFAGGSAIVTIFAGKAWVIESND